MNAEIITAGHAPADTASPTLTLDQVRALLQDATAYAAATRPVVLHAPAPAPQTHPGITVTVPAAQPAPGAAAAPDKRRYTLPELLAAAGLAVAGVSTATLAGLAVTGSGGMADAGIAAVAGLLTAGGAAVAGTRDDDQAQAQAWAAWTETHR